MTSPPVCAQRRVQLASGRWERKSPEASSHSRGVGSAIKPVPGPARSPQCEGAAAGGARLPPPTGGAAGRGRRSPRPRGWGRAPGGPGGGGRGRKAAGRGGRSGAALRSAGPGRTAGVLALRAPQAEALGVTAAPCTGPRPGRSGCWGAGRGCPAPGSPRPVQPLPSRRRRGRVSSSGVPARGAAPGAGRRAASGARAPAAWAWRGSCGPGGLGLPRLQPGRRRGPASRASRRPATRPGTRPGAGARRRPPPETPRLAPPPSGAPKRGSSCASPTPSAGGWQVRRSRSRSRARALGH